MHEAPPILPGPLQRPVRPRGGRILLGMGVCVAWVSAACVVVPLAMGSNIWPIAAAFWFAMATPVAAGVGAASGALLLRRRIEMALPILMLIGLSLAIATGFIISANK